MTSSLSHIDVARLLAEPSPETRAELASKLGREIESERLSESELHLAQDILRVMAKDVEASVREALSHSLRRAKHLPHDVARRLANDIEAVALPILNSSPVLTDADLIAVIRAGISGKQEAIAARPEVSRQVSDVLITDAGEPAVAALMRNDGARISDESLGKVVDRFADSETVKENLAHRQSLPMTVTERLVNLVSDRLKEYLVTHHELPPAVATDIVLRGREHSIINLSAGSGDRDLAKLVAQMHASKRLTPSLVLRALCMGDIAFFEVAVAALSNVPVANVRILVDDAGHLGLKALYDKTGLPQQMYPAVRIAIDVVHDTPMADGPEGRERYRARVIERILTQYGNENDDLGADDLDYLLHKMDQAQSAAA